jgi:choline dehydrogenase-like flavoprotein
MSFVVIGSGPAGVAAAHALSEAGRPVTVLDAGDTIEPGRREVFDVLARSEPESWPPESTRRARGSFPASVKHVPLKPAYGSLFPYALEDADLPVTRENADTLPSLALGGLSNAWGASVLPVRHGDIDDWPIALDELVPHYRAILRFVPLAAEHDELTRALPLYTDAPGSLRRGLQAEMIMRHMRGHSSSLENAGFTFGASRLAVATSSDRADRCRYSGMCLYGCPYGSIYNSSNTLQTLIRDGRVKYHGGVYVDRLSVTDDGVMIHVHERRRPAATSLLNASRVFVACGALSSTRLMLASMGRARHTRRMLDSQYFVTPMITARAAPVSVATQGNTLAQVFVEMEDESVSTRSAHLQLYGYNDVILSLLTARLPVKPPRLERVLRAGLGRLVVLQGYLHSDDSPGIALHVRENQVHLVGEDRLAGAMRVKQLIRRLAAHSRALGMMPIPALAQIGQPGKGNHLGGSFPMRREPDELEADTLGRLARWDRVHLVDASVLPSVPATTITFSVMANAHRIASAAAALAD